MRLVSLLVLLVFPSVAAAGSGFSHIDAAEVAALQADGATVIDVRRSEEWRETGVVPDSRLLTAFDAAGNFQAEFLEVLLRETDPEDPIVLICRSGARSETVGRFLAEQQGYLNVYNVKGGMIVWRRRNYAIDPCAGC